LEHLLHQIRGRTLRPPEFKIDFTKETQESTSTVKQQFVTNALVLILLGRYDNLDELLQLGYQDWYQRILYARHNLRNLSLPLHLSYLSLEDLNPQMISLLSELLRVSGGKVVDQQTNPVSGVVSPPDNLILYTIALGFRASAASSFGGCSRNELQTALSRSRCFVRAKDRKILRIKPVPDFRDLISCLWTSSKVDYLEDCVVRNPDPSKSTTAYRYQSLPSELQNEIDSEQVKRIMMYT
jgi:hypothetical protein